MSLASPKTEEDKGQEIELRLPEINNRRQGQNLIEDATNLPWFMDIDK